MDREKLVRDLLYHIRLGEDSSIEFKAVSFKDGRIALNNESIGLELVAFANAQGGRLVLGVDDTTRDVSGISADDVSKVEEWLVNISQQRVQPALTLHTRLLQLPDNNGELQTVIHAEVPRSIMVHSCGGRYYQRVGSTKRELTQDALGRLFQQRSQSRLIRFDENPVYESNLTDIDSSLKARFLKPTTAEREQLHKLHLLAKNDAGDDCLSIAGVLLLTADATEFLPSAYVQCVAYSGIERNAQYQQDAQDFTGPLDQQIQGAYEFVRKNMRVEAVKAPGRIDIPQYHLGAVYEAIVNAVAHRDYSMPGSRIRIHMFSDRMEIASPGELSNSLTIEALSENTVTRNETIVNLLSRYYHADPITGRQSLIERRGEGVPTILSESEKLSTQRPEYRLVSNRELQLTLFAASRECNGIVKV